MEFGLREWAILFGFIAIGFVLWDGVRRSRSASKYKLPFKMTPQEKTSDVLMTPEPVQQDIFHEELVDVAGGKMQPMDLDFGLDDEVGAVRDKSPSEPTEPALDFDVDERPPSPVSTPAPAAVVDKPADVLKPDANGEWVSEPRVKPRAPVQESRSTSVISDELVTLFVTPKQGVFKGVDLRNALVSMGLSLGDRDLYHRHSGSGREVLYSVANATPEGVFPQGAMEGFTSPGVILLMELKGHSDPEHGFEEMVSSARQMSRRLKADVLDSHQHPLQLEFINAAKTQVKAYAKKIRQGGVAG